MNNFKSHTAKNEEQKIIKVDVCATCAYGSGEVEHSIKTTLYLYCSGFPFFVVICSTIKA